MKPTLIDLPLSHFVCEWKNVIGPVERSTKACTVSYIVGLPTNRSPTNVAVLVLRLPVFVVFLVYLRTGI